MVAVVRTTTPPALVGAEVGCPVFVEVRIGAAVVGLAVTGFAVTGLAVTGFLVTGFLVTGFLVRGFAVGRLGF